MVSDVVVCVCGVLSFVGRRRAVSARSRVLHSMRHLHVEVCVCVCVLEGSKRRREGGKRRRGGDVA